MEYRHSLSDQLGTTCCVQCDRGRNTQVTIFPTKRQYGFQKQAGKERKTGSQDSYFC